MSKLDDILEVSDKHACFNCSTDDIDVPKQQLKQLMIEVFKSCEHDGSYVSVGAFEKKVDEL